MDTESSTSEMIEPLPQFLCEDYPRCNKVPTVPETETIDKAFIISLWHARIHIRSHYGPATQMVGSCGPHG